MSKQIIGRLNEFDPEVENFEYFTGRLGKIFKANSIKEHDKVSYLFKSWG